MNIFQKEFWNKKKKIDRKNLPFLLLSFIISFFVHKIFLDYNTIEKEIFFAKTFVLAISVFGIFSLIFNLPHFNIKEDESNKLSIKISLILIPLFVYFFYF